MKQSIAEWLTALLKDGPMPTFIVTAQAEKAGYKRKELRLARAELNIKTINSGGTAWLWALPDPAEAALKRDLMDQIRRRLPPCP